MPESIKASTYEKLYYDLWETARRYGAFCEFRVIGKSHDGRMIPMLEAGKGDTVLFCVAGFKGTDRDMPGILTKMAKEYCRAYECGWELEGMYPVQRLLDKVRICFIPLLNPDGYEICRQGYSAVRNTVYRQMLLMLDQPCRDFSGNARARDIEKNFPTEGCMRRYVHREPASENETRALMRIFQEYPGQALLTFKSGARSSICCQKLKKIPYTGKADRLARHLKRLTRYPLLSGRRGCAVSGRDQTGEKDQEFGSAEEFFGQVIRRPAFRLEISPENKSGGERTFHMLPLEFLSVIEN